MTAQLSWHVQNFVVIFLISFELEQNYISVEFEFHVENGEWAGFYERKLIPTPQEVEALQLLMLHWLQNLGAIIYQWFLTKMLF